MKQLRWVLSAVAVAAVLLGGAVWAHTSRTDHTVIDAVAGPEPTSGVASDDWRYESYDGVQVRVPPTWGWGAAPTSPTGDGKTYLCGDEVAYVVPGTSNPEDSGPSESGVPFVGRPAMLSDACGAAGQTPAVESVWLGSPLPVGTDESTGPLPAETVVVGSQHVSVFSSDAALRGTILGTAETVTTDAHGCPTEPQVEPAAGPADGAHAASLSVCVYDRGHLLWSTDKPQQKATDYVDRFQIASATYDAAPLCTTGAVGQWVSIGVHDTDPTAPVRWDIVNFDCDRIVGRYAYGNGKTAQPEAPLVDGTVAPWAGDAIKAYVAGPYGLKGVDVGIGRYFRGMLG